MVIKGAIFDVDGTLLDSMPAWENVVEDYMRTVGLTPRENIREELNHMGSSQIPEFLRREYGAAGTDREILSGINKELEDTYFNTAPLKPGVPTLLEDFKRRGIKMCVITATERYLVEAALRRNGILDYFERVYTSREEKTGKSKPEIFLRAVSMLGTPIAETVVFEDALYAIRTAKQAGLPVVAVYDPFDPSAQNEIKALADRYYHSLETWCD